MILGKKIVYKISILKNKITPNPSNSTDLALQTGCLHARNNSQIALWENKRLGGISTTFCGLLPQQIQTSSGRTMPGFGPYSSSILNVAAHLSFGGIFGFDVECVFFPPFAFILWFLRCSINECQQTNCFIADKKGPTQREQYTNVQT